MYWVVYASFNMVESFTGKAFVWYGVVRVGRSAQVASMRRIPMYTVAKVIFLVWCFMPYTRVRGLRVP